MLRSCLYEGTVVHVRLRPKRHRLVYRVFSGLFDLDELPDLHRRLRLFSHNRPNLFSFFDRDHGGGEGSLRDWLGLRLADAGLGDHRGAVSVLCYPRILGYVFNPLSVYFCGPAGGGPHALVYEVNNTHGQRHAYVLPASPWRGGEVRQDCRKEFRVSPFIPVHGGYRFRVRMPGETVLVRADYCDDDGPLLRAAFSGRRVSLTDAALAALAVRYPLLTLKVIGGIHWEAFRLWAKGVPVVSGSSAAATASPPTPMPPRS